VKIKFSRGVGGISVILCGIRGVGGGASVPYKYGKSREVGGGVLSEIPSVVEYGHFLELHNNIYVFFILSFLGYRKTLVSDSFIYYI